MSQLQPVLWMKGDFLLPQHLQAQDRYLETVLKLRFDSLRAFPYGFRTLTVNAARLATGQFSVSQAAGIFPDGLLFDIPNSDIEPGPVSLAGAFRDDQKTLDIALGVPQYRAGGANLGAGARFTADSINLRDETTGLNEKPIQIARKSLRYVLPRDEKQDLSSLPVARILRSGDKYELDPSFIAPVLHAGASTQLTAILRDIVARLGARGNELSQNRKSKNQSIIDLSASDTAAFWLLYAVNTHYPVFRHLLRTPEAHPHQVYGEMLTLASVLTGFKLEIELNELAEYDHGDLGGCFGDLHRKLRLLLETAIPRYYVSLPLAPADQAYVWVTSIPEDRFFVASKFYIGIRAEIPPERLIRAAPGLLKIASPGHIGGLINSAVSGVRIRRPDSMPRAIPTRADTQYFQLDTDGEYWRSIKNSHGLAVYVPGEISNPTMEIVVLLQEEV